MEFSFEVGRLRECYSKRGNLVNVYFELKPANLLLKTGNQPELNWGENVSQNSPEVGAEKPNRKGSEERSQEGHGSGAGRRKALASEDRAFVSVNK